MSYLMFADELVPELATSSRRPGGARKAVWVQVCGTVPVMG